ncbi:hypothetical protein DFJ74DRAFT_652923 [Hyaloraphidium curvatum]|nr:hypothetical protein DFJ74DRAFT_652923 [Hyaloraphidium curvatum]
MASRAAVAAALKSGSDFLGGTEVIPPVALKEPEGGLGPNVPDGCLGPKGPDGGLDPVGLVGDCAFLVAASMIEAGMNESVRAPVMEVLALVLIFGGPLAAGGAAEAPLGTEEAAEALGGGKGAVAVLPAGGLPGGGAAAACFTAALLFFAIAFAAAACGSTAPGNA